MDKDTGHDMADVWQDLLEYLARNSYLDTSLPEKVLLELWEIILDQKLQCYFWVRPMIRFRRHQNFQKGVKRLKGRHIELWGDQGMKGSRNRHWNEEIMELH